MVTLKGKTAVVTGGGRGIGREIALNLADAGANIAILYRKKPESAMEVTEQAQKSGVRTIAIMFDVSDAGKVHEAFLQIIEEFKRIDILVNNAGLASWGNFIHDTSYEEWDKIIKANLYGSYNCIREVLPLMRKQKGGHIINISSTITRINPPTGGPYAVAKAGLETLTKILAAEETGNNIQVNAIAPGLVETDMGRKLVRMPDMKKMYPLMPFGRVCQPAEIADMVLYLVSDKGSYIQREVIHITGGKQTL